jgi:hypothetical protein
MGYSLELTVRNVPPSLNQLLSKGWRFRHFTFKKIKQEIIDQCLGRAPAAPLNNFTISIHRYSVRSLDIDNFVSSLKPALDGLVMAGVIEDDNWELLNKIQYAQDKVKGKENQRMIIRVEEKHGA